MMSDCNRRDFYRQMTKHTDPKEFIYLYNELPDDFYQLCELIKYQLIHPERLSKFRHKLTVHTKREDKDFCTVEEMLEALMQRNANGLIKERCPDERLILSCRYYTILLISILRQKGIPSRCRVGFANYLNEQKSKYIDHWVCEAWLEKEKRWMLIDPDMGIVDIPEDQFLLAGEAWLMARDHEVNPQLFGAKKWWGMDYIRNSLCHDLNCIMGNEICYWEFPEISKIEISKLTIEELQLLDEAAIYLQNVDSDFMDLKSLYTENSMLQFG